MFSTTTGWPIAPPMLLATSRAMMSVAVPAPVGTIIRIGRVGHAVPLCPCAWTENAAATHVSTSPSTRPMRPRQTSSPAAPPISGRPSRRNRHLDLSGEAGREDLDDLLADVRVVVARQGLGARAVARRDGVHEPLEDAQCAAEP